MKNEKKFKEFMAILGEIHDKKISPLLMELYWKTLLPYTDEQCERVFVELSQLGRFFPKPAEFIEILQGKAQEVAVMKWLLVKKTIKQYGTYQSVAFEDKTINAVIEAMGGWISLGEMLETDEKWKGKEFERLYLILSKHPGDGTRYLIGSIDLSNQANGYASQINPIVINDGTVGKLLVNDYDSNAQDMPQVR